MVVIQDPLFWKRFSTAVHLEEAASSPHPDLKHSYASPFPLPLTPPPSGPIPPFTTLTLSPETHGSPDKPKSENGTA